METDSPAPTGATITETTNDQTPHTDGCKGNVPTLRAIPPKGRVGQLIRLRGRCWNFGYWEHVEVHAGYSLALIAGVDALGMPTRETKDMRCELIASDEHNFRINKKSGKFRGWFIVPTEGACFQQNEYKPVGPGNYGILVGCHTCSITRFWVVL